MDNNSNAKNNKNIGFTKKQIQYPKASLQQRLLVNKNNNNNNNNIDIISNANSHNSDSAQSAIITPTTRHDESNDNSNGITTRSISRTGNNFTPFSQINDPSQQVLGQSLHVNDLLNGSEIAKEIEFDVESLVDSVISNNNNNNINDNNKNTMNLNNDNINKIPDGINDDGQLTRDTLNEEKMDKLETNGNNKNNNNNNYNYLSKTMINLNNNNVNKENINKIKNNNNNITNSDNDINPLTMTSKSDDNVNIINKKNNNNNKNTFTNQASKAATIFMKSFVGLAGGIGNLAQSFVFKKEDAKNLPRKKLTPIPQSTLARTQQQQQPMGIKINMTMQLD